MMNMPTAGKIFLHRDATDMRKSFDGLVGIIRSQLGCDPTDGSLFLFINGRRDRIKAMYWDRDGMALWYNSHESEDPHFDIFTGVELHRTFTGIVDETRSTCF